MKKTREGKAYILTAFFTWFSVLYFPFFFFLFLSSSSSSYFFYFFFIQCLNTKIDLTKCFPVSHTTLVDASPSSIFPRRLFLFRESSNKERNDCNTNICKNKKESGRIRPFFITNYQLEKATSKSCWKAMYETSLDSLPETSPIVTSSSSSFSSSLMRISPVNILRNKDKNDLIDNNNVQGSPSKNNGIDTISKDSSEIKMHLNSGNATVCNTTTNMANDITYNGLSSSLNSHGIQDLDLDYCTFIPKVELHAHLHGSIRLSTLNELALNKQIHDQRKERESYENKIYMDMDKDGGFEYRPDILLAPEKSLSECFYIFDVIHHVVSSLNVVKRITREVLEDFAEQNVKYLELRTTPRDFSDGHAEDYIRTIMEVFREFESNEHVVENIATRSKIYANQSIRENNNNENESLKNDNKKKMIPRLLISIDRSKSPIEAEETLQLAARLAAESRRLYNGTNYIVGIDFSGNPYKKSFQDFADVFNLARNRYGFKVSIHTAEIDKNLTDTRNILAFKPNRLGHALWLDDEAMATISTQRIPVEICPTSNLHTLELAQHSQHPTLQQWLQMNHPICICTDDSGVFNTDISTEYRVVAREFKLSSEELLRVVTNSIDQIFEGDDIKEYLRAEILSFSNQSLSHLPTYSSKFENRLCNNSAKQNQNCQDNTPK